MPAFWENFGFSRADRDHSHHNLQDGLFQIASQTCSILVKVNNTNNICFGDNSTNVHYDFGHQANGKTTENSTKVLIPALKKSYISGYKQRLSTVLESTSFGNASPAEDEFDQWEQSFMLRQDQASINSKKWGTDNWCRPSCIPISFILVLIVLVVLVPLLDHSNSFSNALIKPENSHQCLDQCRLELVESIPEGLVCPSKHPSTYDSWLSLISMARNSIEIASFYWTLRENEVYPHNSSKKGEDVFQALFKAGTQGGITINIVQSAPTKEAPNTDTEILEKKKAANVRSVSFPKLLGQGVLHTKLWIIDRKHFYIGSANMDWRSLTQVKELGTLGTNCSCLATDMAKIFDIYWFLGQENSVIPETWPAIYQTKYNKEHPMNINFNDVNYLSYISGSPPPLTPLSRSTDLDAIISVMKSAEKYIYIAVMDYFPLMLYSHKNSYWPHIDNAIRAAAINEGVQVKMLISWWNHSRPSEDYFLRSLTDLSMKDPKISIEVKRYVVPATADQKKIPFARVNHNKYMVTDKVAYIGTSNWSGDYFVNTAGVGFIAEEFSNINSTEDSIRKQLQDVFERDWNSHYALNLMKI